MGRLNRRKLCECNICGLYVKPGNRFIKGHNKGFLGKHFTEEQLDKLRLPKSEDFKRHLSIVRAGIPCKEETKQKLRKPMAEEKKIKMRKPRSVKGKNANKQAQNTITAKANHSAAMLKRYQDPIEREKQSTMLTNLWKNQEFRETRVLALIIGKNTPIAKAKQSKNMLIRYENPEERKKLSLIVTNLWKNPDFVENQRIGRAIKPNNPEYLIDLITHEYFSGWQYAGDYSKMVNGKNQDFVNEETKQIIEVYGDYWHDGKDPTDRAEIFAQAGYETLVIWENELKNIDNVIYKLKLFCNPYMNIGG